MKNIDELYEEWSGESHLNYDIKYNVDDMTDFAEFVKSELLNTLIKNEGKNYDMSDM